MIQKNKNKTAKFIEVFKQALTDVIQEEIKPHPESIMLRETQAHILIGYHLLKKLKEMDTLKLWHDYVIYFDDSKGLEVKNGTISWLCIGKNGNELPRPDFLIITGSSDGSKEAVAIELKCLRSIFLDQVKEKRRILAGDYAGIKKDKIKLAEYTVLKDFETYSSFLCLLHVHDKGRGEINKLFKGYEWQEPVDCDRNYQARYCLQQIHRNNDW